MRRSPRIILALALLLSGARPAECTVAVFDFEFVDTSLEGATNGPRVDERERLAKVGEQLRQRLAQSGYIDVVDIAPVAAQTHANNLRACGSCDVTLARRVGATVVITGWVQKVSNLILNMNVIVRDADSGQVIASKSVDTRGNTDESWSRALDWLVRNYLLASEQGVFQ